MANLKINCFYPFDKAMWSKNLKNKINFPFTNSKELNLNSVDDFNKYLYQQAINNRITFVKK